MATLIDFDTRFQAHLTQWMRENAARYPRMEDVEAQLPDVYLRFVNRRMEELDGRSPVEYFARFDDARALAALMRAYDEAGMSVPDLLLERMTELGEGAVEALRELARDGAACGALRLMALNVLIEMGTDAPISDCVDLIDARGEDDEIADVAAELLSTLGEKPVRAMLDRLEGASDAALITYLDLLCNFPGDERIYSYTVREFMRNPDRRAMLAACLGKLGDARAIEPLRRVMAMEDTNYLDYLEIANAVEMLGGDAGERDRDFSGDPYYESLKQL